jgi:large subunit ribosomal protein L17
LTALLRNTAQSLFEHGQIRTTLAKAKIARPYVEKLVTLAVQVRKRTTARDAAGALRARRAIHRMLADRCLIPKEHQAAYNSMSDAHRNRSLRMPSGRRFRTGEPKGRLTFTADSVIRRLIESVAPRYVDRPGGYTRLTHLPSRRVGDHSREAVLQLVGGEEAPASLTKPGKSARRRRADGRYAFAIKLAKSWSARERGRPSAAPPGENEETST